MKCIVDTSILIDYLRGGSQWQNFLLNAPRDTEIYLPTIAILELFTGKSTKNRLEEQRIMEVVKKLQRVDLTEKIAYRAGKLLRDTGKHIDPIDYIIAASALEIGGEVLTLNTKHFQKIPGIETYTF